MLKVEDLHVFYGDAQALWGINLEVSPGEICTLVGANGGVIHSSDGVTWTDERSLPSHFALSSVWGTSPRDVWVVGDDGTLAHWDGARWMPWNTYTYQHLNDIHGTPGSVYFVGDNGAMGWILDRSAEACAAQTTEVSCIDRVDNDCDGLVDAADPDCP